MAMEDSGKDQSAASGNGLGSRLRYPLRSSTKPKEKPSGLDLSNSSASASRSGRSASQVSKSMSILDISGKNSAAKPPRRLSNPGKPGNGSASKPPLGSITPISETRARRSVNYSEGKSDTPTSEVSKSSSRRKFKLLLSPSYWLKQIKQAEAEGKHTISLGFFKLALEAGCEDIQRMGYELKSYVRRHSLTELGDLVKDLFHIYNISENLDQQVSESCSQVPDEATHLSDDDVNSAASTMGTGSLMPKSSDASAPDAPVDETGKKDNTNDDVDPAPSKVIVGRQKPKSLGTAATAAPVSSVTELGKKNNNAKRTPVTRTKGSSVRSSVNSKVVSDTKGRIAGKNHKPVSQGSNKEKSNVRKLGNNAAEDGSVKLSPEKETFQENKENMGASHMEEIAVNEE